VGEEWGSDAKQSLNSKGGENGKFLSIVLGGRTAEWSEPQRIKC